MAKYESNGNAFINPYNFISAVKDEKRTRVNAEDDEKGRYGYIDCSIEVITPITIPDTSKRIGKDGEHCKYPFFTVDEKPVIPASSIRGGIRSEYETITGSCMGTLKKNSTMSQRTNFQNGIAIGTGILEKKDNYWILYDAERYAVVVSSKGYKPFPGQKKFETDVDDTGKYILDSGIKYYYGDRVYFKNNGKKYKRAWEGEVTLLSKEKKAGTDEGVLYVGETFSSRKHAESVFKKKGMGLCKFSENEVEKRLDNLAVDYQNKSINRMLDSKTHTGYKGYKRAKEKGVIPVWYRKVGTKILSMSFAGIGRIEFSRTVNDIVGNRCKDRKSVCKACNLFGMVGTDSADKSMGGKVRFTDGKCLNNTLDETYVTLKELGGPRTGYLPFYSNTMEGYDVKNADIRGRKFYWHIPEASDNHGIYTTSEKNERNSSHQLVMPGGTFSFRVYYDGITTEQLEELCWVLELGEKDGKKRYHKIGHGKPLGLGSVKYSITRIVERSVDIGTDFGYQYSETSIDRNLSSDNEELQKIREDFLAITDYDAVKGMDVRYPYIEMDIDNNVLGDNARRSNLIKENVRASHQWFTENKKMTGGNIPKMLPTIEDIVNGNDENQLMGMRVSYLDDRDFDRSQRAPSNGNYVNNRDAKSGSGTVKNYMPERGFGFITMDNGDEVFVHGSKIHGKSELSRGEKVSVTYFKGAKGWSAQKCESIY